jgi:serine/threonine protein kinase
MDRIGRYKIIRELGRGAMGVVYHAIDPNIGRPVAIKTINLAAVSKPDEQERMRERLFREARSAGSLSHPGIVTIYDVEQQGDLAYIAMEYVDGVTLDHMLSDAQPMSGEQIFSLLGQTTVALDYAHTKGIVHRDIKPANIMVTADRTVKITDFGIAKITASEQFTMTGSIVGTPHYMSPEQVQGQTIDGRSDQFSLAVIAFEMLTGEKPYTGEHLTTVVYKIVAEEPPVPHLINPSLTSPIENVLRKGLSKKPDARYGSCAEFVEALESACAASPGWEGMPRGGSLSAPTVAQESSLAAARAGALPPPRRAARPDPNTTHGGHAVRQKSKFLPFLAAVLVAGALLAVIGWEAKPWLNAGHNADSEDETAVATKSTAPPKPAPTATKEASPEPAKPAPTSTEPPAIGQAIGESKPSAIPPTAPPAATHPAPDTHTPPDTRMPPPEPAAKASKGEQKRGSTSRVGPQRVEVVSSPIGALAMLDGQADTVCTTPCTLEAGPGHHRIQISKSGFEMENRDVEVGAGPIEVPAVVLRALQGTLMLSSEPPGASILIDGKPYAQPTNARITLPPGSHDIAVQWRDGKSASKTIEIRNGINYQKFIAQ